MVSYTNQTHLWPINKWSGLFIILFSNPGYTHKTDHLANIAIKKSNLPMI